MRISSSLAPFSAVFIFFIFIFTRDAAAQSTGTGDGWDRPAIPLTVSCADRNQRYTVDYYVDFNPNDEAQMRLVTDWAVRRGVPIEGQTRGRAVDLTVLQVILDHHPDAYRVGDHVENWRWLENGWWRNGYNLRVVAHVSTANVAWSRVCSCASADVAPNPDRFHATAGDQTTFLGVGVSAREGEGHTPTVISYDTGHQTPVSPNPNIGETEAVRFLARYGRPRILLQDHGLVERWEVERPAPPPPPAVAGPVFR